MLLTRLKSLLSWRPHFFLRADRIPSYRIHLLPTGLELLDLNTGKRCWQINWQDVKEIVTYKVDLFGFDLICIGFRTTEEPEYFEVSEDDQNWNTLCDHLQTHLGIDWPRAWLHVVFPAFVANHTTIWGDPWPPPCPNCNYDLRYWPQICPECGRPVDPPALLPSNEKIASIEHPPDPR
jgi:hypothetical protein